jgi:diguanylate cyclase (GGDEF)-like protein
VQRFYAAAHSTFAVLFFDIDRFRSINDSSGHAGLDEVLKEVGARLIASLRSEDLVARLGGDEFVVIVDSVKSADEALFLVRKIQHQLSAPFFLSGAASFEATASIGVALLRDTDHSGSVLLKRADEALYQAKAAGRATCRFVA